MNATLKVNPTLKVDPIKRNVLSGEVPRGPWVHGPLGSGRAIPWGPYRAHPLGSVWASVGPVGVPYGPGPWVRMGTSLGPYGPRCGAQNYNSKLT